MARNHYPRHRNGDEYYPVGRKPFIVDPGGKERYARDRKGNELYPKNKNNQFARDKHFREYYARDCKNNEFYPRRNGFSLVIRTINGYEMAKWANGLRRYPTDAEGNEYYLTKNGLPILIHRDDGEPYFAKNKRGVFCIPWNVLHEYVTDTESHVETTDSLGNRVFIWKNDLPQNSLNGTCRCLCVMFAKCPCVVHLSENDLPGNGE